MGFEAMKSILFDILIVPRRVVSICERNRLWASYLCNLFKISLTLFSESRLVDSSGHLDLVELPTVFFFLLLCGNVGNISIVCHVILPCLPCQSWSILQTSP